VFTPRIWKSTDGGAHWQRIVDDGEVLALDPSRSGRLYAARSTGLARSDDGGRTWRKISTFGGTAPQLTDLLVDPRTPATLYAGTAGDGVWRSTDSGSTWAQINAGLARYGDLLVHSLALHPTVPHLLYAIVESGTFVDQISEP
jgi:photosystem II stability/assembly factor-like uncharacterized protein